MEQGPDNASGESPRERARNGIIAALIAYISWGVLPLYFILVKDVGALELLVQRVIWAIPVWCADYSFSPPVAGSSARTNAPANARVPGRQRNTHCRQLAGLYMGRATGADFPGQPRLLHQSIAIRCFRCVCIRRKAAQAADSCYLTGCGRCRDTGNERQPVSCNRNFSRYQFYDIWRYSKKGRDRWHAGTFHRDAGALAILTGIPLLDNAGRNGDVFVLRSFDGDVVGPGRPNHGCAIVVFRACGEATEPVDSGHDAIHCTDSAVFRRSRVR